MKIKFNQKQILSESPRTRSRGKSGGSQPHEPTPRIRTPTVAAELDIALNALKKLKKTQKINATEKEVLQKFQKEIGAKNLNDLETEIATKAKNSGMNISSDPAEQPDTATTGGIRSYLKSLRAELRDEEQSLLGKLAAGRKNFPAQLAAAEAMLEKNSIMMSQK